MPKCASITLVFFTLNYNIKVSISISSQVNNFSFFHLKLQYQSFYFFVLDVNQLKVAKMNNFSLLQIIERIPELSLKHMGSYPSDRVPQLTKNSFAIVNSAPSNDRGEHGP